VSGHQEPRCHAGVLGGDAVHGRAGNGSEDQARTDPGEAQSGEQPAEVGGRLVGPGEEDADGGGIPYPADPLSACPPHAEPLFCGSAAMATNPEDWLLSEELREHIEAAIETLPPKQREVIVLRDVEGWAPGEVCNMLGISESNQRVLLHRARVRVRDALAPYLANP